MCISDLFFKLAVCCLNCGCAVASLLCRRGADSHTVAKVIGFIGRVSSEKGVGLAMNAFRRVLDVYPNARFRVIGTGFLVPYLREIAASLGMADSVELVGFRRSDELPAELEQLDLVVIRVEDVTIHSWLSFTGCGVHMQVFPSTRTPSETFAIVNVEAMAMELPVVSFGVPGTLDYFEHGRNAIIASPVSPQALAKEV